MGESIQILLKPSGPNTWLGGRKDQIPEGTALSGATLQITLAFIMSAHPYNASIINFFCLGCNILWLHECI